jgi:Cu+-exporting ATPase
VSILSQCVTVRHPAALSYLAIKDAIENAGFDVAETTGAAPVRPPNASDSSARLRLAQKHLDQCHVCQQEFKSDPDMLKVEQPTSSRGSSLEQPIIKVYPPQGAAINGADYSSNLQQRLTLSVGGMTCASCATTINQTLSSLPGVHDVAVSLLGNSATAILDNKITAGDVLKAVQAIGYQADVASIQPLYTETTIAMDGPLRLALSIGGMTCSACSSTITRLLSEQEGVTDVSVNLIGFSASLVVDSKELIPKVQEVIESAGYEASVVSMEPIKLTSDISETVQKQRTVALRIEGMFCEYVPKTGLLAQASDKSSLAAVLTESCKPSTN